MAPVLDIDSLLESPLADLHALAGELDIEGYRLMRKPDLTLAILQNRGADVDQLRPAVEAKAAELAAARAERERLLAEREEAEEAAREAEREAAAQRRRERSSRGSAAEGGAKESNRGGRQRGGRGQRRPGDRPEREGGRGNGGDREKGAGGAREARGGRGRGDAKRSREANGKQAATSNEPPVPISGVFEPGSGGGGRLRTDIARRVRADADVQRSHVRKWHLHRGDTIVGEARKVQRGRSDFQLVSITTVNGQTEEQRAAGGQVKFSEAKVAAAGSRFAKKLFKHAPILAGSRAVITGPTRAAARQMIDALAHELAGSNVATTLVIVVGRSEDEAVDGSRGFDFVVNRPGKPAEDALSSIDLALERGKRLAENGGDAALLIDGIDLLPAERAAEIFSSSRNLAGHGSLTVVGSAGAGSALEAQAATIAVVAGGRKLKLDKKASWSSNK